MYLKISSITSVCPRIISLIVVIFMFMNVHISAYSVICPMIDQPQNTHIALEDTVQTLPIDATQTLPINTPDAAVIPAEPYSESDVLLLERVTMSEAGDLSFDCQVAVAQTILNRLSFGGYGDSIPAVVYSPHQYSVANNGEPTNQVKSAVQEAIHNPTYPTNMLFFREYHYHSFAVKYKLIDGMYFSLQQSR